MNVTITAEDISSARSAGSVIVVTGTDQRTGQSVTFAGDARPTAHMLSAALAGEVTCAVEPWQILAAGDDRHEYEPDFSKPGDPCRVCGFGRHHPWHGQ